MALWPRLVRIVRHYSKVVKNDLTCKVSESKWRHCKVGSEP